MTIQSNDLSSVIPTVPLQDDYDGNGANDFVSVMKKEGNQVIEIRIFDAGDDGIPHTEDDVVLHEGRPGDVRPEMISIVGDAVTQLESVQPMPGPEMMPPVFVNPETVTDWQKKTITAKDHDADGVYDTIEVVYTSDAAKAEKIDLHVDHNGNGKVDDGDVIIDTRYVMPLNSGNPFGPGGGSLFGPGGLLGPGGPFDQGQGGQFDGIPDPIDPNGQDKKRDTQRI